MEQILIYLASLSRPVNPVADGSLEGEDMIWLKSWFRKILASAPPLDVLQQGEGQVQGDLHLRYTFKFMKFYNIFDPPV